MKRFLLLCLSLLLAACGAQTDTQRDVVIPVPGGDATRGRQALMDYGCGSCHTIPGVPNADALVGAPLTGWAGRRYIAGSLPNEPENLIFWIRFPQQVEPGTAMPDLGVEAADARDMAAYLYTLQGDAERGWSFGLGGR